ncbi:hypothetical protein BGX34_007445 [Mortierella sp. NVP85]|nr:hypothetical protein BGX34_007445 [Mortierella sp. NVP85]
MNFSSTPQDIDAEVAALTSASLTSEFAHPGLTAALLEEDALVHRIRELSQDPLDPQDSHELQLAAARAGKKVCRSRSPIPTAQALPNEVLIRVFEYLLMDQRALWSAASVCLDWNHCATGILYRYPQFASTLHWALFIQTLSRSKESTKPKTRRKRSIIPSYSQPYNHHPSPHLSQIKACEARPHWSQNRLYINLGEFVRGIDLSPKTALVDQAKCSCSLAQESPASNRNCIVHPEVQSATSSPTVRLGPSSNQTNPSIPGTARAGQGTASEGTGSWDEIITYSWHRNVWLPEADPNSTLTTSSRPWMNSDGAGNQMGTWTSTTPYYHANLASSQRWSILWSMENQYRQATAQSNSLSLPTVQAPTSTSSHDHVPGSRLRHRSDTSPYLNGRHSVVRPLGDMDQGDTSASAWNRPTGASSKPLRMQYNRYGQAIHDRTSPVKAEAAAARSHHPIIVTVSSLIQMAGYCPNLESLSLGSSLTADKMCLETGDYESMLQAGPSAGLTLVPVTIADGAKALGKCCPKLHKLWMANCEWVTSEEIRIFVTYCRQLQTLDVRNCSRLDGRLGQLFVVGSQGKKAQEDDMDDKRDNEDSSKDFGYLLSDDMERRIRAKEHPSGTATEGASKMATSTATAVMSPSSSSSEHSSLSSSSTTPVISVVVSTGPTKRVRDLAMYDLVNAACGGKLETLSARRRRTPPEQSEDDSSQQEVHPDTQEHQPENADSGPPQSNSVQELGISWVFGTEAKTTITIRTRETIMAKAATTTRLAKSTTATTPFRSTIKTIIAKGITVTSTGTATTTGTIRIAESAQPPTR